MTRAIEVDGVDITEFISDWPTAAVDQADGAVTDLSFRVRGYYIGSAGVRELTDVLPGGLVEKKSVLFHDGSTVWFAGKIGPMEEDPGGTGDFTYDKVTCLNHNDDLNIPIGYISMGTGTIVHGGETFNLSRDTHRVRYAFMVAYGSAIDHTTYIPDTAYVTFTTPKAWYKTTLLKVLQDIAGDPGPDLDVPIPARNWYVSADWNAGITTKYIAYFSRANGSGTSAAGLTSGVSTGSEISYWEARRYRDPSKMINAIVMAGPGGEPADVSFVEGSTVNVEVEGNTLRKSPPPDWQASHAYAQNAFVSPIFFPSNPTSPRPTWVASQVVALNAERMPSLPLVWATGRAYTLNQRVRPTTANGYQYRCTTAGTTSGIEPAWPLTAGQTVTSGTAVFTCIDIERLWYRCTTAGTTAATEPVWPTTAGSTIADNTAVWTCIDLRTASFKNQTAGTNNSGTTEPLWPTALGGTVVDNAVTWERANYFTDDGGAFGEQSITTEGGYVACRVPIVFQGAFGFSTTNVNTQWNTIRFGIGLNTTGTFTVMRDGNVVSTGWPYTAGDQLRVDLVRTDHPTFGVRWTGQVYRDSGAGWVLVEAATFTTAQISEAMFPMYPDFSLATIGGAFEDIIIRRHSYSQFMRQDSVDVYGTFWADDVYRDDLLDTVERRRAVAERIFDRRAYPRVTMTLDTLGKKADGTRHQFRAGQLVNVREPKFGWNPQALVIARVTTDWSETDDPAWPIQRLEVGDRLLEQGEDDVGYLLRVPTEDRTAPDIPTGLLVAGTGLLSDDEAWALFEWTQTVGDEQWIHLRIQRTRNPLRTPPVYVFPASSNRALLHDFSVGETYSITIAAEDYAGNMSPFGSGILFTAPRRVPPPNQYNGGGQIPDPDAPHHADGWTETITGTASHTRDDQTYKPYGYHSIKLSVGATVGDKIVMRAPHVAMMHAENSTLLNKYAKTGRVAYVTGPAGGTGTFAAYMDLMDFPIEEGGTLLSTTTVQAGATPGGFGIPVLDETQAVTFGGILTQLRLEYTSTGTAGDLWVWVDCFDAVTTESIKNLAVTSGKIANSAITSGKLGTGAVTAGKIGTGGISAATQFAAGVVDSAALGSGAVIAGKIATGGVSAAAQFAAGVVDAAAIGSGAVTNTKLGTITDATKLHPDVQTNAWEFHDNAGNYRGRVIYDSGTNTLRFQSNNPTGATDLQLSAAGGDITLDGSTAGITYDTLAGTSHHFFKNGSVVAHQAALATTATDGFLYIPSCAGAPTGTPTAQTGTVPIIMDTTNTTLYAYIGGAWKKVTLT